MIFFLFFFKSDDLGINTDGIPILSLRLLTLLIVQLSILNVIMLFDCGIKYSTT